MKTINQILIIGIGLFLASCSSKEEDLTPTVEDKIAYVIEDVTPNTHYFTKENSNNLTFDNNLLNNLGVGTNGIAEETKISIFNPNPSLSPIIETSLDEYFSTQIIASWELNRTDYLEDSIIQKGLKLDKSFISNFSHYSTSKNPTLYIRFILYKRFGTVSLNLQNEKINELLTYKTSLVQNVQKSEIKLTPEQFYNNYGNSYVNSMTLGNFAGANITITNFDVKSGKDAVILETIAGLRQVLMGKTTWDKFTAASRYLKETQTVVNRSTTFPKMDFNLSLDHAIAEFNKLGNIYEKGDFGILGKSYKPFSTIYPDYKFLP
ncbi:hypothetical protein [Alistipes sp. ZOR0009]|uniref:hypothetical protein n=1 Tax=Alistipes sp. ZOR0009 TaxID=1339253 RepID=UPI0006469A23|nr:hypothetical protein [Alistipes sp. ZOR0009]